MVSRLATVAELSIGSVFLTAVTGKLRNPRQFADIIAAYEVVPEFASVFLAYVLIPLELSLALSHLSGIGIRIMAPVGVAVLVAFAVAVTLNLLRGRMIDCGCFGVHKADQISSRSLFRLLILLLGELIVLRDTELSSTHFITEQTNGPEILQFYIPSVVLVLICAKWLFLMPDLVSLFGLKEWEFIRR